MKQSLFVIVLFLLAACSNTSNEAVKEKVIGKWQYDATAMMEIFEEQNPSSDELMMIQQFITRHQNDIYDFQAEDVLIFTPVVGTQISGTWGLSPDGEQLFLNLGRQGQPNPIGEITDQRMVLIADSTSGVRYTRVFQRIE